MSAQDAPALAPAVPVRVSLVSATGAPLAGEGHVVFLPVGSGPPLVYPVKLPAAATAQLPAGSQWTVRADFPAYYAPISVLRISENPSLPIDLTVGLRPAGLLTGNFSLKDRDGTRPERLEVRFEPSRERFSKGSDPPAGVGICAVAPDKRWRCKVPAGRLDLALHPRGFVPHYLWRLAIAAGETRSLPPLVLSRGASVAGWVTLEDGTVPRACRARLVPVEAPGRPGDPLLEFLRKTARDVPCQRGGFFQLSGVAEGSYTLIAESGSARALLSPLAVLSGTESRLKEPLVLRQPVDFLLELTPATDWMERPWQVEVRRASDYRAGWEEPPIKAASSRESGRVRLARQLPGRFWITVFDWAGNAVFSDLQVDLSDPTRTHLIQLDLLWLEGSVHLGDEPVQGRLFFGGRSGATAIRMVSDRDGRFEGPLPREGHWRVDVEGDQPSLRASVKAEVKRDGNAASATIELPDTHVYGRVVDPAGNPVAGAEVALDSIVAATLTESDERGEFHFRVFPEGANQLSAARRAADGGREVSDAYTFEASENAAHGPVVLALQRNVAVRGRVLAATGPMVGATVSGWPAAGGDGSASIVRTGLDGGFNLKLPQGTNAVRVIVSPPGGKLKAYEARLAGAEELVLLVEAQGGDILIELGERADDDILAVWQDEIGIPFGVLRDWTAGNGVRFLQENRVHLPQLAAGFYTVCSGAPAVVENVESWRQRARCSSGYLAADSALELRFP